MTFDDIHTDGHTFEPNRFEKIVNVGLLANVDKLESLSDEELLEEAKRLREQILLQTDES